MTGPGTRPVMTVIHGMGAGGAEAVAEAIVRDQLTAGDRPVLAASGGFRLAALRDAGAQLVPLRLEGRRPLDLGTSVWRLRAAARDSRPGLVHAHNVKATLVARLAVGRSVPVLATVHGVPDREYATAARILRRCADRVIAVAPGVADRLATAGLPTSRIRVIENGVMPPALPSRAHARAVLGLPADVSVVGCVARMVPQKRHDLLVEAWRSLGDAHLVLVGDGPTRGALERSAAPSNHIRFLGERSDIGTVLAATDLIALPTDWEGLPISLLEAMSAGVPVLTSDVADLRETLGPAARLVPPGSAAELRTALGELLASPGQRAELARRGRALVARRFGHERMLAAYRAETAGLIDLPRPSEAIRTLLGVQS